MKYPVDLSLRGKACAIVGLGAVGKRKLKRLLSLGPDGPSQISLFDCAHAPKLPTAQAGQELRFYERAVTREDIVGQTLVFACTNDPTENTRIAHLCRELNVLCNSASTPEEGDVSLPAIIAQENLLLTLSTNGASPALAKKWRAELEAWAAQKLPMLRFMARLRPRILALESSSEENAALFSRIADGPLETLLADNKMAEAEAYVRDLLPKTLEDALPELFYDLL